MSLPDLKSYKEEYLSLLKLGAPVLVAQVGIIVVSFADTMMVGDYGTRELAASAFVNNFFMVPVVMLIGFASGVTPLIGALFGRKDFFEAGRMLRAALRVNALISIAVVLIMAVMYFFIDRLGQPPELLPVIRPYYLLVLAGIIPMAIFNCCQQMANGITDTALPMWIMLCANIINISGNWFLIYGHYGAPELGLTGAGISTLAARLFCCLAMIYFIRFSRRYRPYHAGMRRAGLMKRRSKLVWDTSYPIMIQNGVECFLWAFGAIVCGWFGTIQLASYQVVNIMSQLGFMIFISFGVATSIRVANLMGTRNFDAIERINNAGLHINLTLGTIASLVFLVFGRNLIGCFTSNPDVISAAMMLILPLVLYQYGDATQLTYANALRGTGHVKPLLWISLTAYVLTGVPVLLLFAKIFGWQSLGVYYSFPIALFLAAWLLRRSFLKALTEERASDEKL
ncbi:MAG: MATE family efflux transporter [Prevotella sp.]|nr:MATE family efflux transporter [Bacteroides sp.]MCM1365764.1 MATE family efflux transporter [Prevotella sp.]MCM1436434.1 MATE family efflux transporter [Prevotella sp.]